MPFATYSCEHKTLSEIQDEITKKNQAWAILNSYRNLQNEIRNIRNTLLVSHGALQRKKMKTIFHSLTQLIIRLENLKPSTVIIELRIRNDNLKLLYQTEQKKEYLKHALWNFVADLMGEIETKRSIAAKEYNSFATYMNH